MRWPLRHQILLPMAGLIVATVGVICAADFYFYARATRQRIEQNLHDVAATLSKSNFPLTNAVLRQMRGLAGADFVLTDGKDVIASSTEDAHIVQLASANVASDGPRLLLGDPIESGQGRYFHGAIQLRRQRWPTHGVVHVIYAESRYRQAIWEVAYVPFFVGGIALVCAIGLSLAIASRVTRPLRRLQSQVDEIATGEFEMLVVPNRNDELTDLATSVNRMSEKLAVYEDNIRRIERLRTLGQLGGGIAHQLRNSVTGCKIAVDLHARQCSHSDEESLSVASRQLHLMERHLQRFLSLGRSVKVPHCVVNLHQIAQSAVSLIGPTARHLGVNLELDLPQVPILIQGDEDSIEQLLVNLLLNAVQATSATVINDEVITSTRRSSSGSSHHHSSASSVTLSLKKSDDWVEFEVCDTGRGPAPDVAEHVFEPFVSSRADGTGLGLAVAQEVAAAHEGAIRWQRRDEHTQFIVEFPIKRMCT